MIYIRSLLKRAGLGLLLGTAALGLVVAATRSAQAQTETVLYSFGSQSGDGLMPVARLIMDKKGNLYGTTWAGGTGSSPHCYYPYATGCGTVFKLSPPTKKHINWTETVLYSFPNSQDEDDVYPVAGVIMDKEGNLYGTTSGEGDGAVFKLTPTGVETLLHVFTGEPEDGSTPMGDLIMDAQENLYGTTDGGGSGEEGTVFRLTPTGWETLLYNFPSQSGDGWWPDAGLIMDKKGNLYGTTRGVGAYGGGTVFMLTPNGTETVLYNFCSQQNCADGWYPLAGLIMDRKGNLYGTTLRGGAYGAYDGTVFKLSPSKKGAWTETVLYSFCSQPNCADGISPYAGLIMDKEGNLYGTTSGGGAYPYWGTVFELTPQGVEKVLYSFGSQSGDGSDPMAGLIMDKKGNLYGTTEWGGAYGYGTVFKLTP